MKEENAEAARLKARKKKTRRHGSENPRQKEDLSAIETWLSVSATAWARLGASIPHGDRCVVLHLRHPVIQAANLSQEPSNLKWQSSRGPSGHGWWSLHPSGKLLSRSAVLKAPLLRLSDGRRGHSRRNRRSLTYKTASLPTGKNHFPLLTC